MLVTARPVGAKQLLVHGSVVKVTDADHGLSVAAPVEFVQTACTCTSKTVPQVSCPS